MAKLYFYYSTMNAGKSTALLQAGHNYEERGMRTLLYTAQLDQRQGGLIHSRIGIQREARHFHPALNLRDDIFAEHRRAEIACVLVDESQFLTPVQVKQLGAVVDELDVPVLCYGLRTDFRGELFPESAQLLGWADNLIEIKTICHCGRKAIMVVRVKADGSAEREALHFFPELNLREQIGAENRNAALACVLVDESQFLTPAQVKQLGAVVDELNIPVLCYGLRTDFRGELFPGSAQLLAWADNLVEIKTICHCGRKAIMVVRVKADGTAEREGAQIEIGGNERYVPLCRRHFSQALAGAKIPA